MKGALIAAAVVAGMTTVSVANADDPEDKIIGKDRGMATHSVEMNTIDVYNAVETARQHSYGVRSVTITSEDKKAIFVTGKTWNEIAENLLNNGYIRDYLNVK